MIEYAPKPERGLIFIHIIPKVKLTLKMATSLTSWGHKAYTLGLLQGSFGSRIVLHVYFYLINFSDLLVGCIFRPALCVLHCCVFLPAFGWLVIHWYLLSWYCRGVRPYNLSLLCINLHREMKQTNNCIRKVMV